MSLQGIDRNGQIERLEFPVNYTMESTPWTQEP